MIYRKPVYEVYTPKYHKQIRSIGYEYCIGAVRTYKGVNMEVMEDMYFVCTGEFDAIFFGTEVECRNHMDENIHRLIPEGMLYDYLELDFLDKARSLVKKYRLIKKIVELSTNTKILEV